jgi:hypothetical protein
MSKCLQTSLYQLATLALIALLYGCDLADSEVNPQHSFSRIYNDELFESSYIPLDIQQTSDSGYLILSARDAWNTHLLKADAEGHVEWVLPVDDAIVNPLPDLFEFNGAYYFLAMNDIALSTLLVRVEPGSQSVSIAREYADIIYPLSAAAVDGGLIVQSYDRKSFKTKLSRLDAGFNISWEKKYDVFTDVEAPIVSHITRIGDRLPFFTGKAAGQYFFNGFINYSFSTVFVSTTDGEAAGVINGFRESGALSSAVYVSGNTFALSRYSFGDNYIIPRVDINTSSILFSDELAGNEHPEMTPNAPVHSELVNVNGTELIMYATDTKSGQLLLYAYDPLNGQLRGTLRLGEINPYRAVSFEQTSDGGLAVLGSTDVAGRFSRICLFKLSKQQMIDFVSAQQ